MRQRSVVGQACAIAFIVLSASPFTAPFRTVGGAPLAESVRPTVAAPEAISVSSVAEESDILVPARLTLLPSPAVCSLLVIPSFVRLIAPDVFTHAVTIHPSPPIPLRV